MAVDELRGGEVFGRGRATHREGRCQHRRVYGREPQYSLLARQRRLSAPRSSYYSTPAVGASSRNPRRDSNSSRLPANASATSPAAPWLRPPLRSLRWVEQFLTGLLQRRLADDGAAEAYRAFTSFLLGHFLLELSALTPAGWNRVHPPTSGRTPQAASPTPSDPAPAQRRALGLRDKRSLAASQAALGVAGDPRAEGLLLLAGSRAG